MHGDPSRAPSLIPAWSSSLHYIEARLAERGFGRVHTTETSLQINGSYKYRRALMERLGFSCKALAKLDSSTAVFGLAIFTGKLFPSTTWGLVWTGVVLAFLQGGAALACSGC